MLDIDNITDDQLLPIFSNVVSEQVTSFQIRHEDQKKATNGIMGEYLIPTVTCQTSSGKTVEFTLFVRRRKKLDVGRFQAHHYAFLEQNSVPIPHLYGVLKDDEGGEVLFLEHLDEVISTDVEFYRDRDTLKKFITLMARLNSLKPSAEYAANIGFDMAERDFTMNWRTWLTWSIFVLDYIEKNSERNLFGDRIKQLCHTGNSRVAALKQIALELTYVIPILPVGYIHGDFLPGNTGWRKNSRELVVFDFEDVSLDTRFYDIALVIGDWDTESKNAVTQRELAEMYLETYNEYGGDIVSLEEFTREIKLVWYSRKLNLWEYLPANMLNAPSYHSGMPGRTREERLNLVYHNLQILLNELDTIRYLLKS